MPLWNITEQEFTGLVKYYLSGDWECVEGFDKGHEIVESHIKDAF